MTTERRVNYRGVRAFYLDSCRRAERDPSLADFLKTCRRAKKALRTCATQQEAWQAILGPILQHERP